MFGDLPFTPIQAFRIIVHHWTTVQPYANSGRLRYSSSNRVLNCCSVDSTGKARPKIISTSPFQNAKDRHIGLGFYRQADKSLHPLEANMYRVLFWVILITLFWLGLFVIPRILVRRAVLQVVRIFRQRHALCSETPKAVEELGLAPQSLVDRLFKPRDYKPYALQLLISSGVIRLTEGGRMCLLEDELPELQRVK